VLQAALREAQERAEACERDVADLRAEADALQGAREETEAHVSQYRERNAELEEVLKSMTDRDTRLHQLEAALATAERLREEQSPAKRAAESRAEEMEQQVEVLQAQVAAKDAEIIGLKQEVHYLGEAASRADALGGSGTRTAISQGASPVPSASGPPAVYEAVTLSATHVTMPQPRLSGVQPQVMPQVMPQVLPQVQPQVQAQPLQMLAPPVFDPAGPLPVSPSGASMPNLLHLVNTISPTRTAPNPLSLTPRYPGIGGSFQYPAPVVAAPPTPTIMLTPAVSGSFLQSHGAGAVAMQAVPPQQPASWSMTKPLDPARVLSQPRPDLALVSRV